MSSVQTDRAAWLEERRKAIGASEVAAILGISPWSSQWDIWADKTGRVEAWEGNDATRLGNSFEAAVLDVAEAELGKLERNVSVPAIGLPLISTCDAITVNTERPVEAKTTGLVGPVYGDWGDEGTDHVPDNYLVQVHAQLICTGADVGYLFALIPGRGVVKYEIATSPLAHQQIGNILSDWWERHIVQGVEPSRDKASFEVVKRLRKTPNKVVVLPEHCGDLLSSREVIKEEIKALESQLKNIDKNLLLELGDAEEGVCPVTGRSISYYSQHRKGYTVEPCDFRVLRVSKPKKGKK
jgi:putative phage-type endonuclease